MSHRPATVTVMRDGEEIEPDPDVSTAVVDTSFIYHALGGCAGHVDGHVHMTLHVAGVTTPPTPVECPTCSAEVIDQAKHDAAAHPPVPPPSTAECPTCSADVYDQAKHDAAMHPPPQQ